MAPNIHLKLEKNTAECRQILGVDSNSTPKEIKQEEIFQKTRKNSRASTF